MTNKFKNLIQSLVLSGAILSQTHDLLANDIVIGTRGPTECQMDARVGYSEKTDNKGRETKTATQNDVLKYWDGNKLGVFGFLNIPSYKSVDNGKSRSDGFGDLVLGAGPRGRIDFESGKKGSLHFISYAKATLPTADVGIPALGNDRIDIGAGAFLTYISQNKKWEIDGAFDYSFAGKNSKGFRGMDLMFGGLIAGGRIYDSEKLELRIAGGLNGQLREDGAYCYGPRAVLRVTPKFKSGKRYGHFEIVVDKDMQSKNMPKGFGVTGQVRVNF